MMRDESQTMPHPTKKQKLEGNHTIVDAADNDFVASLDDLSVDVLANILAFLTVENIIRSRRINKKVTEAVRKTIVPPTDFRVNNMESYNAMTVMTTVMPNLQQIDLHSLRRRLGYEHKYNDGEDPDEDLAARTASYTAHDIEIISNFRKLRILEINNARLNGRYPVLFNFPLLQKLSISNYCRYLKWDLEMLSGMPLLKELVVFNNHSLTGNIKSLRVIKDTLEKVTIYSCENVEGNLMDLADFPRLKKLNLFGTAVTGDIRDISDNDFSSLEQLILPKGVYGGKGYQLQSISDGPDLIRTLYLFNKQRPSLIDSLYELYWELSRDSPDWYGTEEGDTPPFYIGFVQAGSRIGYRWLTWNGSTCEVTWLDPKPDSESSDYEEYIIQELHFIANKPNLYKGFYQPPTEEEYHRLPYI